MNRAGWILLLACGVAGYALMLIGGHAHGFEAVPLFYGIFGFAGAAGVILAATWLGRAFVQRPEDFYGDD